MNNLNTGHGHVRPRPDGAKARCGGPGLCAECSKEAAGITLDSTSTKVEKANSGKILNTGIPKVWGSYD